MIQENRQGTKTIKSYRDLVVYQKLYEAMLVVLKEIIPKLPKEEKYDLADQMRRCCKAPPALLAEGFAKRYQKANWKRYLNDTLGECNEMINHLSVCIDVYSKFVNVDLCEKVLSKYDVCSKQITSLKNKWKNFHEQRS